MARLLPSTRRTEPRPLDLLAGQVRVGPDFDDPLPEENPAAFEGRGPGGCYWTRMFWSGVSTSLSASGQ